MPRTSNIAVAMSAAVALTLGTATYGAFAAGREGSQESRVPAAQRSCSAPGYHNPTTRLGVNLSTVGVNFQEAAKANRSTFGRLPVVRYWDTHGDLSTAWTQQAGGLKRGTAMVVSFRYSPQEVISGQWDQQISGFFKKAPRKRLIFWNFYHEPEEGVKAGQFTPTQFRQAWRHVAAIAARYCRSNLFPTLVLQGWTADPRSGQGQGWQSWKDFYPGRKYTSVVAWDPYNSATHVPSSYGAPSTLYKTTVRASRSVGKRWAIAETGSALVAGDSGARRAAWLHKVARYSRHHHAAFVTYFNSPGRVNDFRLLDGPSIKAWRSEMHR